jgi:hypothetical protein
VGFTSSLNLNSYDIRSEGEVELTQAFIASSFPHFSQPLRQVHFATMIEHHPDLDVHVAFPVLDEYSHSSGNSGRVIELAVSFRNCRISGTQLDRQHWLCGFSALCLVEAEPSKVQYGQNPDE